MSHTSIDLYVFHSHSNGIYIKQWRRCTHNVYHPKKKYLNNCQFIQCMYVCVYVVLGCCYRKSGRYMVCTGVCVWIWRFSMLSSSLLSFFLLIIIIKLKKIIRYWNKINNLLQETHHLYLTKFNNNKKCWKIKTEENIAAKLCVQTGGSIDSL